MGERTSREIFIINQRNDAEKRYKKALRRCYGLAHFWRFGRRYEDDVELKRSGTAHQKAYAEYDDLVAETATREASK